MPPQLDARIVELLCSRLCHDLVGPIGAVNNGIELLEDFTPEMAGDVLPLITSSARQAWRRLDFFRVAFGFGGGREGWALADLQRFASGLLEDGKARLNWPGDSGQPRVDLDAAAAKILLNMVLLGSEALPRGGEVSVAVMSAPPGWRVAIAAAGQSATLHERVGATLLGKVSAEEVEARTVQAFFTLHLVHAAGGTLKVERQQDRVTLIAIKA